MYLTYVELEVLDAICVWCVAYAAATVAGTVVAGVSLVITSKGTAPA